jgi:hypothetical protein
MTACYSRRYIGQFLIPVIILGTVSSEEGSSVELPLLHCYISSGDNFWIGQALPVDSKASIEASFDLLQRLGIKRVYWRGLEAATWVDAHQERAESPRYFMFWSWLRHLYKDVDPDRLAVQAARKRGMEIWGVANLVDWGSQADAPPFKVYPFNSESKLRIENPEWVPVDKYGVMRQGGPIEFAYPKARKALVDLHMKYMRRDGYDGMVFLTYAENHSMRFQDEFGFNEPIVNEFKKRYGIDIRNEPWKRFATRFDWYHLRGEYLTQFVRELKSNLNKSNQKLGFFLQPWNPHMPQPWNVPELMLTAGSIHLDLETWIQDGLVDEFLIYGNSDRQMQTRAVKNLLWMTRQTESQVGILTSGPSAKWWKPFQKNRVPTVVAWGEDSMYLERSFVPVQKADSLKSDDPLLVMKALSQIVEGKLKAPIEEVTALTLHPHLIVRRLALRALGKLKDPRSVPLIEEALFDPENSIRCMAALALRDNHRPESLLKILDAVERNDNHPLEEILRVTIPRLKPNPREQLVTAYKTNKHEAVRRVAMRALRFLSHPSLLTVWQDGLKDPDRFVRFVSAEGLGTLTNRADAIDSLIRALELEDVVVATRAAVSLSSIVRKGGKETTAKRRAILAGLQKLYAQYGGNCARADAEWGYRPVGNALLALGEDGEAALRKFLHQTADTHLAELAWKTLFIRQKAGSFSEVTEKENELAFRNRPLHMKRFRAVRLKQDFDDPDHWLASTRGSVGNVHKVSGRWGGLLDNGPLVDATVASSGRQSLKLNRGGASFGGQALPGITDGADYVLSIRVYPQTKSSSFLFYLKGFNESYKEEAGLFMKEGGAIFLRDVKKDGWVDTGLKLSAKEWSTIRLRSNRNLGVYGVSIQATNQKEVHSPMSAPLVQQHALRLIQLFPQPPADSVVFIDDIEWLEIL